MKRGFVRMKGKLTAAVITGSSIIVAIYYLIFGLANSLGVFIIFLGIPFVWWLGTKYDQFFSNIEQLTAEKQKAEMKQDELKEHIIEYARLINSLEGVIYSIDINNNNYYFLKGSEQIYNYPCEAFMNNPNLWREVIHPDDVMKVEENKKLWFEGESTNVEYRVITPEQEERWILDIATPIIYEDGTVRRINGQILDITDRKKLEDQLKQLAYTDDLTDLANRSYLDRHMKKALSRAKRHNHNLTIMFIDLDDFKVVNDTMGHDAGDLLLKEVVNRLKNAIREEDLIARIGGDEFIIVFEDIEKDEIENIAGRILDTIALPYEIHEKEATISLSIGISMFPDDGEEKDALIECADKAMYFAKNTGKNNYKMYTAELEQMEFKKMGIVEKIITSIQNSKLFN